MNILSTLDKKLKVQFADPKVEHEYLEYRKIEIQKNLRYFLGTIVLVVAIIALYVRERNSAAFVALSLLLY